jgi:arylsulfatase A-like enzyme
MGLLPLVLLACRPAPVASPLLALDDPPRNVLIVSIDTLRRDAIGRYGGAAATPVLDGLLDRGVTLDDHRSCASWTYPSVTCALTGVDSELLGFVPQRDGAFTALPGDVRLLADLVPHRTALVSANPLLGPDTGTARGYDEVCATCDMETPASALVDTALASPVLMEDRWLLHVHFMDPHLPYESRPGFTDAVEALPELAYDLTTGAGFADALEDLGALEAADRSAVIDRARAWYDSQIASMDQEIGRMLSDLDARGLLDDTLIVVWSDHGEQIFDHLGIKHGSTLYAEETRGIAAFVHPGLAAAAWDGRTSHADLVPSVLDLLDEPVPTHVTGLAVGVAVDDRPRFATVYSTIGDATRQSVEVDGWRLIYSWDGQMELFDLTADPTEHDDQWSPTHPKALAMWTVLQPRVAMLASLPGAPTPVPPSWQAP